MTQFNPNKHHETTPDNGAKRFPTSPRVNSRRNDASFSPPQNTPQTHSASTEAQPQPTHTAVQGEYQLSRLKVANREVLALTKRQSMWQDFYHASMTSSWWRFILWSAIFFFSVNLVFATLYAFKIEGISNIPVGKPWFVFFFSVETFATVGYGNMHPVSFYAHTIAMVESFTGLLFSAVITGLVFARFARPSARIIFAKNAVVGRHEGQMMWMTRVANERHNHINGAQAKLWLVRTEINAEGHSFRRFTELTLRHKSNPLFVLNWTIMHPINKNSPLYGMTAEDWAQADFSFVVILEGTDETLAQSINARHTYHHKDVRWYERFADMKPLHPY
ncbi:MAG: Inward rectifier potassium channel [Burkholderiales bacterium]|nr:Inward rectifier potassium channel [Burkholderiales bacterium]